MTLSDGIFVLNGEHLVELTQQPYDTEDVFQALLAKYPNLLAGGQMNRVAPRRWLLISREVAVPGEMDGGGRWSLDHLFLDQDAIPTLIEVKRSTDTRIRREVVGQMLDYAANAVVYWPVEKMRAEYEASCEARGVGAEQEVEALIGQKMDVDQFWQSVKTNLQAGKIRMVFVADVIPTELQRIVEFLNQQMDPAEVLAVEIKQYVGQGLKTLVPRVIGQTAEAEERKGTAPRQKREWNEQARLDDTEARCGVTCRQVAADIFQWARESGLDLKWGSGAMFAACAIQLLHGDFRHVLFDVYSNGRIFIRMKRLKLRPPFDSEALRQELADRLNAVPGIRLSGDLLNGEPGFDLAAMQNTESIRQFLGVMKWAAEQIIGT
jgi:hypothetical protein